MSKCPKCNNNPIVCLAELPKNTNASVVSLTGGKQFQERLSGMGLNPGCQIKVLSNGMAGPVLIAIGETRIAIGKGMLQKIMVIPE